MDLLPYRALVGGSTQGIGRAVAQALAERGCALTLLARNEATLRETVAALPAPGGARHDYLVANFDHPDQVAQVVHDYLAQHPAGFQILVNNTGGPPGGPLLDAPVEALRVAFNQHLVCNHLLAQAVVPGMRVGRFDGEILPGAMPWLHQYIGNPVLTGVLNRFFGLKASDAHSGMRAFTRDAYDRLGVATEGMEFASEIVINAAHAGLKVAETPITYHPRIGESKLHSFRDGWRHLRFMLLLCPKYLFLLPGLALLLLGSVGLAGTVTGNLTVAGFTFGIHWTLLSTMLVVLGYQSVLFGLFTKAYARQQRVGRRDWTLEIIDKHFSLEKGLVWGGVMLVLGAGILLAVTARWIGSDMGELDALRPLMLAMTLMCVGSQTAFGSFFLSLFGSGGRRLTPAPREVDVR